MISFLRTLCMDELPKRSSSTTSDLTSCRNCDIGLAAGIAGRGVHGSCVLSASLVWGDMSFLPEPECCGVKSGGNSLPWIEEGVEFWTVRPDEDGCWRGDGSGGEGLIGIGSGSSSPKISSKPLIREQVVATGRHFALKLSSCPQIWVAKLRSSAEGCPFFIPLSGYTDM